MLRQTVRTLVLLLLPAALSALSRPALTAEPVRPNLLLITADDLNWDSVGANGSPLQGATPNIDRLAREGMRFTHAHVAVAVCMPCRASLMTGRYPVRSGAMGFEEIRPEVPTVAERLHAAGYLTGLMAKVPHVIPSRRAAWDQVVEAGKLGQGRSPELYYEHARAFFRQAKDTGKPFFLMANSQDPHRPFAGSDQERLAAQRPNREGGFPPVKEAYRPDQVNVPGFLPDLPDVRQEIAEYFTSVRRGDRTVGEVLRALEEAGLEGNTLVMFLSDNGMALPFSKTNCYRFSTRTPWIARWPGKVKRGSVDDRHLINTIDFAPTVLEAAGLPPLEGTDGRSLLPLLRGEQQPGRDRVFTSMHRTSADAPFPMRAVHDRRFGYIYNAWADGKTEFRNESQSGRTMRAMRSATATDPSVAARVKHFLFRTPEELYDYEADPHALRNLIEDASQRERIAQFRRELLAHLEATGDPLLVSFRARCAMEGVDRSPER